MKTVTSPDATTIAYETFGDGPAVVVVGGATNRRADWVELAQALAADGFTGVTYDRRGRGDSTDTRPYDVAREIEDLAAVIDAVGGSAGVHAISSGGALAYRAVAAGLPVATLSVLEAPYRVGDAPRPPAAYVDHLADLYAADDAAAMMEYFMTAGVGQPQELVEQLKGSPYWPTMVAVAPTVYYDALCLGSSHAPLPTDLLAGIAIPVLSVASTGSAPFLVDAARAAGEAVPQGRFVQLEGEFHSVPTATLAPVLAEHHRR